MTRLMSRMLLAVLAMFAVSTTAAAQSSILVVDMEKVYTDSKVGRYISSQMKTLASSDEATLKSRAATLESTGKSLEAQTRGLTQQAVAQNTALVTQVQSFYKSQNDLAQEARKREAELRLTQLKARSSVDTQLKTIFDQIAQERGASAIMSDTAVMYLPNSSNADITATVIARLDQRMTSTAVTRQSIPTR